jgi:hypothetical protein
MFKNKAEFEKSKEKVKYTMEIDTGACKLEIVFAMKPKADGSVSMKLRTQIKMGWAGDIEEKLAKTMKTTQDANTISFSVPE